MKYLKLNIKTNNYFSPDLYDKYVYVKQSNKDMDIHRIFKIINMRQAAPVIYEVEKAYYFTIPFNKNCQCFCYNDDKEVELSYRDQLYIMTEDEYLNTFREFIKCDGKHPNEIPSKIIQDDLC